MNTNGANPVVKHYIVAKQNKKGNLVQFFNGVASRCLGQPVVKTGFHFTADIHQAAHFTDASKARDFVAQMPGAGWKVFSKGPTNLRGHIWNF